GRGRATLPLIGSEKPTTVNPLRSRNKDMPNVMFSIAGILANLTIAIVTLVLFKMAFQWSHLFDQGAVLSSVSEPVGLFLWTSLTVNVSLAVFNLVPIPPLDGSKVLWTILPDSMKP